MTNEPSDLRCSSFIDRVVVVSAVSLVYKIKMFRGDDLYWNFFKAVITAYIDTFR